MNDVAISHVHTSTVSCVMWRRYERCCYIITCTHICCVMYAHLLSHDTKYCHRYERCSYITCTHIYCHMTRNIVVDMNDVAISHVHTSTVTWHMDMCEMIPSHLRHAYFICTTQLIHIYRMTHSYVSLICISGKKNLSVWRVSYIYNPWLVHSWDMAHSHVWGESFTCVTHWHI